MTAIKESVNASTVVTKKYLTKIKPNKAYGKKTTQFLIFTLRLTQNSPLVTVDHAAPIDLLKSSPMTNRADKNKMNIIMTMVI